MHKDDLMEEENERKKEEAIAVWIAGGASPTEALALWDDIRNDPWAGDADLPGYCNPTIEERINRFSKK